ncbi:MAG: S-layer homology domain-containing protein [Synechococcales bacterium]|nr:S-layer homology domain-containing protein [Synechococcales bacterium]
MADSMRYAIATIASLTTGALIGVGGLLPVMGQSAYPDVEPDYWAYPYIQRLTERDILTGYLDGTYRPEQPMDRDEFAAVIRRAFEQGEEREIESGSAFTDVPEGYWAEQAIAEAYETGFMQDVPASNNEANAFNPDDPVTRLGAVLALVRGLELSGDTATQAAAVQTLPEPTPEPQAATPVGKAPNQLVFPLAATVLMQPLFAIAQAVEPQVTAAISEPAEPEPAPETAAAPAAPPTDIIGYYQDADQIPETVTDQVAAATEAGIVVNYPDPTVFGPNELLLRSTAAALIYQTLVAQGEAEPISDSAPYVAAPEAGE